MELDGGTGVPFFKMTGSGNDFVFLDGRREAVEDWTGSRIVAICHRRTGVGGDGLAILAPEGAEGVRMHFFNADGGRAEMCGNAALCSTRLAARLGLARPERMHLLTDAGRLETRCIGPGDMAEIHLPDGVTPADAGDITAEPGEFWMTFAKVGVPHLVIRVRDIDEVDLLRRGAELRRHPQLGPAGANANFVSPPRAPGEPWRIRTYERGVEGETLACGTGTAASALALASRGEASLPVPFVSRGGAPLAVAAALGADGAARDLWLTGQGRLVFEGVWHEA
ncbi:MAG TPA: diaminopimelate epimerase [Gemmatimonadales bacterium]|jgi:diaminopimelate epimerase|nr:diaminopimelate epimerase [Gemmatimonadales bacterium]